MQAWQPLALLHCPSNICINTLKHSDPDACMASVVDATWLSQSVNCSRHGSGLVICSMRSACTCCLYHMTNGIAIFLNLQSRLCAYAMFVTGIHNVKYLPVSRFESLPAGAMSRNAAEPGSLYGTSVFWDEYAAGKMGPQARPGDVYGPTN